MCKIETKIVIVVATKVVKLSATGTQEIFVMLIEIFIAILSAMVML